MKIIVVGGNAAGPGAAAKAKRVNSSADVILFEAGDQISTGSCELPYVLSGEIDDFRKIIFFDPESFFREKGVKAYTRHRVEMIDRKKKQVIVRNLSDGNLFESGYDKLILTTGASSNKLAVADESPENLFYLKTVNDYLLIRDYLKARTPKRILIVGSGYIGIEAAEAFKSLGYHVVLLEKEKFPMPGAAPEVSALIKNELDRHGIQFHGGVMELKFAKELRRLVSVKIDGRFIEFDLLISAAGFRPNNDLAIAARLEIGGNGALKVDNKMRTSDPSISAAGDNVQVINKITSRPDYMPLATIAHEQGHIAGANAAGGNLRAHPVVKNIAVKIFDNAYAKVGLNENEAVKYGFNIGSASGMVPNLVPVMPGSQKVFGKILYDKKSRLILGADFFGSREVVGYGDLISAFIYNQIPGDKLSEVSYNYTPPLSPFVNLLSTLGRRIK